MQRLRQVQACDSPDVLLLHDTFLDSNLLLQLHHLIGQLKRQSRAAEQQVSGRTPGSGPGSDLTQDAGTLGNVCTSPVVFLSWSFICSMEDREPPPGARRLDAHRKHTQETHPQHHVVLSSRSKRSEVR